jgi:hypothetical protein
MSQIALENQIKTIIFFNAVISAQVLIVTHKSGRIENSPLPRAGAGAKSTPVALLNLWLTISACA